MSRSLNRAALIGHLGSDPEVRSTQSGSRVATLSLATSRQWKDASGTQQEKTEWHRVVCWNAERGAKLADVVEQYAHKGDKLYVEGSIEYRSWQDREGQTRYTTEIRAHTILLLSERKAAPASGWAASSQTPAPAKASDDYDLPPDALDDPDDPTMPF